MRALSAMTAEIVASYVRNHKVTDEDLPELILRVQETLSGLAGVAENWPANSTFRKPAVPISRSVMADRLVCLEDGKSYKSLKRHLRDKHGLSPESYRSKWGLPGDYPMVASNYKKRRSKIAKDIGFGRIHSRWPKR
jgi:predicted transcriptional regulator